MKFLIVCACGLLSAGCASKDGVSSNVDVNPVHAPLVNQVLPARDAVINNTAAVGAEVLDVILEPIRFVFNASTPGYVFPGQTTVIHIQTPEERLELRRQHLGLPPTAETRIEARRSLVRTHMRAAQIASQQQLR